MTVRIGVVDSGIHAQHPHVGGIQGGVSLVSGGLSDRIGHGTAVAAAIRAAAPQAELYSVRIFGQRLTATIETLLAALDWCLEERMDIVNLSVGTANNHHSSALEERLRRASAQGTLVISASEMLPGCLPGAIAVAADPELTRHEVYYRSGVFYASPYPRDIPGVPRNRNLSGVSFAVANLSGIAARCRESLEPSQVLRELQEMGNKSNPLSR